jgi:hypothetical protein
VLFGFETVSFKGGNDGAGLTGFIRDGNVGANGNHAELLQRGKLPTLEGSDVTVNICANERATMSEGSQVVGNTVRFARPCTFWDLFANAVGQLLATTDRNVTVLACGERWLQPSKDGELRFAIEDYLGAGAILAGLPELVSRSPEAALCVGAFRSVGNGLRDILLEGRSGRELRGAGYPQDVEHCAQINPTTPCRAWSTTV